MAPDESPDEPGVTVERTRDRDLDARRRGAGARLADETPVGAAIEEQVRHDHDAPCAEPRRSRDDLAQARRGQPDEGVRDVAEAVRLVDEPREPRDLRVA